MVITNPKPIEPFYELQYWLVNGISLEQGKDYKIVIECKAEGASDANIHFKLGDWGGGDEQQFTIPVGKGYQKLFVCISKMANNGIMFQHGDFAGKIYWKSITISHSEAPAMEIFTDQVSNGNLDSSKPTSCFVVREAGKRMSLVRQWLVDQRVRTASWFMLMPMLAQSGTLSSSSILQIKLGARMNNIRLHSGTRLQSKLVQILSVITLLESTCTINA